MEYKISSSSIKIDLKNNESIIINDPNKIAAFKGDSSNREDFIDTKIKVKKNWIKTKIKGDSTIYLSIPNSKIKVLEENLPEGIIILSNVIFYSYDLIKVNYELQKIKAQLLSPQLLITKYSGNGIIGYYGQGDIINIKLKENEEIFVNIKNVIGYSTNINYTFRTYGNLLAASRMQFHYKFKGPGIVFLQTENIFKDLEEYNAQQNSLVKRILQQIIPGGEIIIP